MTTQDKGKVAEALPEVGGISAEAIGTAKAMIGIRLRIEEYIRDASLGALINFVNGIGDDTTLFSGTWNTPNPPSTER